MAQLEKTHTKRATDGGTYLVVVDAKHDMQAAINYAKDRVTRNKAYLALAYVIDTEGYATWEGVQDMMRKELRAEAEKTVWPLAKKLNEESGIFPSIHIEEGGPVKQITATIKDKANDVRELILGAGSSSLISYFTGKGMQDIHVPLVIIPHKKQDDAKELKEEIQEER